MEQSNFPAGWGEERVRKVLEHYERQTEEQALAEDEVALEDHKTASPPLPSGKPRVVGRPARRS
jgi:hypothetical protein